MAAAFVADHCTLNEAVANQSGLTALQTRRPHAENLLGKEVKPHRRPTWSSDLSTAVGDTESEVSSSPRSTCSITGNILSLSSDPEGCRRVQDALEEAACDRDRELLASELHGNVVKAMHCPHANHVLQKCISTMPPASLQFMIDELMEQDGLVRKMAIHRFGSRIVQQLLRKCGASQVRGLAEAVLQDAAELSCSTYGNYAVQRLLESGTEEQKYSLVRTIERNMASIARSTMGGGVIDSALSHAAAEDLVWIARAVVQDPKVVCDLAQRRHGHEVVLKTLCTLSENEQARASRGLRQDMATLRASKYGSKVAAYLEGLAGQ